MVLPSRETDINQVDQSNNVGGHGARETVWSVKDLLCKYEDPSETPQNTQKQNKTAWCTCDPTAGEAETGGSLGLGGQVTQLSWQMPGK